MYIIDTSRVNKARKKFLLLYQLRTDID